MAVADDTEQVLAEHKLHAFTLLLAVSVCHSLVAIVAHTWQAIHQMDVPNLAAPSRVSDEVQVLGAFVQHVPFRYQVQIAQ